MRYKTILLFGAPGSGKGTQGKILGAIPGFFHTACGDIFRSLDLSSEMGRIAWEYSSRGELVPDQPSRLGVDQPGQVICLGESVRVLGRQLGLARSPGTR